MQHRRVGRKLHRVKRQRVALLRGLMRSIILERAILTTEAKAKEMRPQLERLITRARKATVASQRFVVGEIGKDAASVLKKDVIPTFGSRTSGYVRIIKHGQRKSDGSRMAFIQFVDALK